MDKLKLIASDHDDLAIIAAALQDAIVKVSGLHYDKTARALTLRMSRFRHEANNPKNKANRVEAGLRIDGVLSLQSRGIDRANPEAFAVILDVKFTSDDELSGTIDIVFAGGGEIRAHVEALDVILADTDNMRETKIIPSHDT
ncbi:MAG: DUF2948 family protein [Litorimonas sp.]